MLVYPFFLAKRRSTNQLWIDQLSIAAMLFGLLPVVNFFTTNSHLGNTLFSGNWVLAGFDLTMLALSLSFSFAAYRLFNKKDKPMPATGSIKQSNSDIRREKSIEVAN